MPTGGGHAIREKVNRNDSHLSPTPLISPSPLTMSGATPFYIGKTIYARNNVSEFQGNIGR